MNNGLPLLGEKMPEMIVKTTHGDLNIPKDYNCYDWWFCHKKI